MTQIDFVTEKIGSLDGTVHAFVPCPRGPATRPYGVILYERPDGFDPFVVHYIDLENGARWQGSYCQTMTNAWLEFARRVQTQVTYVENKVPIVGQPHDREYLP